MQLRDQGSHTYVLSFKTGASRTGASMNHKAFDRSDQSGSSPSDKEWQALREAGSKEGWLTQPSEVSFFRRQRAHCTETSTSFDTLEVY